MKKRTVGAAVMTTALMGGLLAGCGGSDKNTLIVWGMGEEAKSLPAMAEAFTKENPDIKVKVQALPWDSAHDKLLTAVASKKGPDVLQMGTTWIPEFAAAGALMDLKPYQDQYPEFNEDKFYPGSVATTQYDGKTVGAPWYIDTRVLFYRTDLLKSVGYDAAPKTWDELQDAAKKLKARGDGKYGMSIDVNEQTLGFMFARQNGSKLLDGNKPLFNQPEFVEAIDYLNSFFKDGTAPVDLGMDIVPAFAGEGILPMFISGPWMVKLINDQAPDIKGKWATAVLPKKENNISTLGGSNLSVFQYTKKPEAAMKFIAFMSKPESQLKWMELTTSLPATKEAWNDPKLKEDPNYKVFGEQLETAEPLPLIKTFEEISAAYKTSFEKIYRGSSDTKTEMDAFNKKAGDILNK